MGLKGVHIDRFNWLINIIIEIYIFHKKVQEKGGGIKYVQNGQSGN